MIRPTLLVLAMFSAPVTGWAAYAQAVAPANWAVTAGQAGVRIAANDAAFTGGVRSATAAVVNVAGKAVSMPVAYRFAANAGRFAAASAFGNPALFLGIAAASLAYQYYQDGGFSVEDGIWKKTVTTPGFVVDWNLAGVHHQYPTASAACGGVAAYQNSVQPTYNWVVMSVIEGANPSCRIRSVVNTQERFEQFSLVPGDLVQKIPATQAEFEIAMADVPLTTEIAKAYPIPIYWPVGNPILNPSADPVPVPQSLRVPQGSPQAVPNTSPVQYKTPVVDIIPAPIDSDPWRAEVLPRDVIQADATPLAEAPAVPNAATPTTEPDKSLCDLFPDILACAKLGEVPASDPKTTTSKAVEVVAQTFAGSAVCPSPITFDVFGTSHSFGYSEMCSRLAALKVLFVAAAALLAAYILTESFKV